MAKKRKLSNVTAIRSKEMKELKDLSDDPGQQSEGAGFSCRWNVQSGTLLKVSESAPEQHPEKVSSAREHLKTVLQELLVLSDESSDEQADEKEEREAREREEEAKLKDMKKEKLDDSRTSKRRRRRIKAKETQYHHTYVMKLFDRSVDLAQFKEETPLYPICRAWMVNQPRSLSLMKHRRRRSSADQNEEDEDEEEEESNTDGDPEKVKNTFKLPPPIPLPSDNEARRRFRIPSPIPYEKSKEIDMDLEIKPSRETLLRAHVLRWAAIRKKWHKVGHKNEARFGESASILRNIYKQAQSSFGNISG